MERNNLQVLRLKKCMTLKELSLLTGFTQGYLSGLEKGKKTNPTYLAMKKIANALNCKISNIFE